MNYKYKRALERTDATANIPEDVWQKAAEADKAMEEGHQSYATVEKLVAEAAQLRTDAERAALQFANVQAAMQAPSNVNLNGHVSHVSLLIKRSAMGVHTRLGSTDELIPFVVTLHSPHSNCPPLCMRQCRPPARRRRR